MKKLIRLCLPIGLLMWLAYRAVDRYIAIPNIIVVPVMIISIFLMLAGTAYNGWCIGNGKSPYNFKKKK